MLLPTALTLSVVTPAAGVDPDPGCEAFGAWLSQANPQTDTTGFGNNNFPEGSATTYWGTHVQGARGRTITVRGRYPRARFTSLQVYAFDELLDHLSDTAIVPDPGQNNPFVSGAEQGTYTVTVIFGAKPANPPPNTLYTRGVTDVHLLYRIYHSTDPNSPGGETTNPELPDVWLGAEYLPSCPTRPVIHPEDATPWGRLDNANWAGKPPLPEARIAVSDPARWKLIDPYASHFFPNGDNYYMGTMLSREFLRPHTDNDLFVVRFKAPTFPKTRSGELVHVDRQVRFWSLCTDDPYTTNVNRCVPDSDAVLSPNGYATFVISDPGGKPSDAALQKFSANWLAWGALAQPGDVVYDRWRQPWGINTPVHYYNAVIYRQTQANPSFAEAMVNVVNYPPAEWAERMGPYWPVGGYCARQDFEAFGVTCITR